MEKRKTRNNLQTDNDDAVTSEAGSDDDEDDDNEVADDENDDERQAKGMTVDLPVIRFKSRAERLKTRRLSGTQSKEHNKTNEMVTQTFHPKLHVRRQHSDPHARFTPQHRAKTRYTAQSAHKRRSSVQDLKKQADDLFGPLFAVENSVPTEKLAPDDLEKFRVCTPPHSSDKDETFGHGLEKRSLSVKRKLSLETTNQEDPGLSFPAVHRQCTEISCEKVDQEINSELLNGGSNTGVENNEPRTSSEEDEIVFFKRRAPRCIIESDDSFEMHASKALSDRFVVDKGARTSLNQVKDACDESDSKEERDATRPKVIMSKSSVRDNIFEFAQSVSGSAGTGVKISEEKYPVKAPPEKSAECQDSVKKGFDRGHGASSVRNGAFDMLMALGNTGMADQYRNVTVTPQSQNCVLKKCSVVLHNIRVRTKPEAAVKSEPVYNNVDNDAADNVTEDTTESRTREKTAAECEEDLSGKESDCESEEVNSASATRHFTDIFSDISDVDTLPDIEPRYSDISSDEGPVAPKTQTTPIIYQPHYVEISNDTSASDNENDRTIVNCEDSCLDLRTKSQIDSTGKVLDEQTYQCCETPSLNGLYQYWLKYTGISEAFSSLNKLENHDPERFEKLNKIFSKLCLSMISKSVCDSHVYNDYANVPFMSQNPGVNTQSHSVIQSNESIMKNRDPKVNVNKTEANIMCHDESQALLSLTESKNIKATDLYSSVSSIGSSDKTIEYSLSKYPEQRSMISSCQQSLVTSGCSLPSFTLDSSIDYSRPIAVSSDVSFSSSQPSLPSLLAMLHNSPKGSQVLTKNSTNCLFDTDQSVGSDRNHLDESRTCELSNDRRLASNIDVSVSDDTFHVHTRRPSVLDMDDEDSLPCIDETEEKNEISAFGISNSINSNSCDSLTAPNFCSTPDKSKPSAASSKSMSFDSLASGKFPPFPSTQTVIQPLTSLSSSTPSRKRKSRHSSSVELPDISGVCYVKYPLPRSHQLCLQSCWDDDEIHMAYYLDFIEDFQRKYILGNDVCKTMINAAFLDSKQVLDACDVVRTCAVLTKVGSVKIDWEMIDRAAESYLGIFLDQGNGGSSEKCFDLFRASRFLHLVQDLLTADLHALNLTNVTTLRQTNIYRLLSADFSNHTGASKRIIHYVNKLLLGIPQNSGSRRKAEQEEILPVLMSLLSLCIELSTSSVECANTIASDLARTYNLLPGGDAREQFLTCVSPSFLRYKLVECVLQAQFEGCQPVYGLPDSVHLVMQAFFKVRPMNLPLTPPTTPDNLPMNTVGVAKTSPISPEGGATCTPAHIEEMGMLLFHVVDSYLMARTDKSYIALGWRYKDKVKVNRLPTRGLEGLKVIGERVDQLEQHLTSLCPGPLSDTTRHYMEMLRCLDCLATT